MFRDSFLCVAVMFKSCDLFKILLCAIHFCVFWEMIFAIYLFMCFGVSDR